MSFDWLFLKLLPLINRKYYMITIFQLIVYNIKKCLNNYCSHCYNVTEAKVSLEIAFKGKTYHEKKRENTVTVHRPKIKTGRDRNGFLMPQTECPAVLPCGRWDNPPPSSWAATQLVPLWDSLLSMSGSLLQRHLPRERPHRGCLSGPSLHQLWLRVQLRALITRYFEGPHYALLWEPTLRARLRAHILRSVESPHCTPGWAPVRITWSVVPHAFYISMAVRTYIMTNPLLSPMLRIFNSNYFTFQYYRAYFY